MKVWQQRIARLLVVALPAIGYYSFNYLSPKFARLKPTSQEKKPAPLLPASLKVFDEQNRPLAVIEYRAGQLHFVGQEHDPVLADFIAIALREGQVKSYGCLYDKDGNAFLVAMPVEEGDPYFLSVLGRFLRDKSYRVVEVYP